MRLSVCLSANVSLLSTSFLFEFFSSAVFRLIISLICLSLRRARQLITSGYLLFGLGSTKCCCLYEMFARLLVVVVVVTYLALNPVCNSCNFHAWHLVGCCCSSAQTILHLITKILSVCRILWVNNIATATAAAAAATSCTPKLHHFVESLVKT